jgi:hypothetical protein
VFLTLFGGFFDGERLLFAIEKAFWVFESQWVLEKPERDGGERENQDVNQRAKDDGVKPGDTMDDPLPSFPKTLSYAHSTASSNWEMKKKGSLE